MSGSAVQEQIFASIPSGIALTDEHRARINACNDLATIEHWIDASFKAKTAADLLG